MAGGQDLLPVEKDEGQVERIARPPDAPFAIDHPFQPFLDLIPAYIKIAHR